MLSYSAIADEVFDIDANLQRPEKQVKLFVNNVDAKLFVRLNELFTERAFTLTNTANVSECEVDPLTSLESIKYHSLRCVDQDATPQRMVFLDYFNEWRERYPTDEDVPAGFPQYWTYRATKSASEFVDPKILLAPVPEDVYTFEYWAKLNHKPLTLGTDKILWSPVYEHVLVDCAREMLGTQAGPNQQLSYYAQQALDGVKAYAKRPVDKRLRTTFGGLKIDDGMYDAGIAGYVVGERL